MRGADDLLPLGANPGLASTPACAGLTAAPTTRPARSCLYPRVRGADLVLLRPRTLRVPLPPYARG